MKGKMMPHIIAVTALVVFIVLGLACASPPPGRDDSFSDPNLSVNEQSIIMPLPINGVYLNSIDRKDHDNSYRNISYDMVIVPPGEHELALSYDIQAYSYDSDYTYTWRFYTDSPSVVTVNLLPGHYYALLGGHKYEPAFRKFTTAKDFGYCIIDFTTKDYVLVWSSDYFWGELIMKYKKVILPDYRRAIKKQLSN
jgi:hypothetical protein